MIESFLLLFTGIIGLATISLMVALNKSNPFYNVYLLIIIGIIAIRFLILGSFKLNLQTAFSPDDNPNSLFYLIIPPAFYLYNKSLVLQSKLNILKNLKHLVYILCIYFFNIALRDSIIFYFGPVTNVIFVCSFILLYTILTFRFLSKHLWFKINHLENQTFYSFLKKWTINLFILYVLTTIGVLSSIYAEVGHIRPVYAKLITITFLFFWLVIYLKIVMYFEVVNKINSSKVSHKNSYEEKLTQDYWVIKSDIKRSFQDVKLKEKIESNVFNYIQKIDRLSSIDSIFRDPKASQTDIAKALEIPTSHITYLFKYHSKISFSEYRMRSRIIDALMLIDNGFLEIETLESLAFYTGFASYNPFFKAFKKMTSYSPQHYLKMNRRNFIEA